MSDGPQLGDFGLKSTGLAEVDRRVLEIAADTEPQVTPQIFRKRILGNDIYFGQVTYRSGTKPYTRGLITDDKGSIDELLLTQEGARELPEGFREKAALLEEEASFAQLPETFPVVTGWQLVMTWGYFHMEAYRAQRVEALYKDAIGYGPPALSKALRKDPIVVISPIVLARHLPSKPHFANETFGMFGRYNRGDIVPAAVDFKEHPYMEEKSFEDKQFMQSVIDDFLPKVA